VRIPQWQKSGLFEPINAQSAPRRKSTTQRTQLIFSLTSGRIHSSGAPPLMRPKWARLVINYGLLTMKRLSLLPISP